MVRAQDAKSDCSCRGKSLVLTYTQFKPTWSEFQIPSQNTLAEAKPRCVYSTVKPHGSDFHHLPRVSPKQLCALAHLDVTTQRASQFIRKLGKRISPKLSRCTFLESLDVRLFGVEQTTHSLLNLDMMYSLYIFYSCCQPFSASRRVMLMHRNCSIAQSFFKVQVSTSH